MLFVKLLFSMLFVVFSIIVPFMWSYYWELSSKHSFLKDLEQKARLPIDPEFSARHLWTTWLLIGWAAPIVLRHLVLPAACVSMINDQVMHQSW